MSKLFLIISFLIIGILNSQNPKASFGKIDKYENFDSKYVSKRNIEIWLPENYTKEKKYSVLYMHDGQMLYDETVTWNKQAWNVDDVVQKLLNQNKVKDVIVVGIWNSGSTRHSDYFPQKPFESLSENQKNTVYNSVRSSGSQVFNDKNVYSDNYLKFIVEEVKPFIDKTYSVKKNRKNTFIAGSSMGGLISMYAICEYPHVFGGAACLSTHWVGIFDMKDNPIPNAFYEYLKKNLPNPKKNRIYFDYGDQTLDALYPPLQAEVDKIMKEKGFSEKNWKTVFAKGEDHSENAWNKRLDVPLIFLLGK